MRLLLLLILFSTSTLLAQYTIPIRTGATAGGGGGGPVITLDGSGCIDATSSGTTAFCTLTVPTAGDLITVALAARNSGSFTVTDSNSHTYSNIWTASDPSNPVFGGMAYFANSASGSITVTVTIPTAGGPVSLYVLSWKGASTTSPLDSTFSSSFVTASTAGTVANGNCGTARTPGAANELVISFGLWDNVTPSVGTNFTLLNSIDFMWFQAWIQTTATSTNGAWVSAADDWIVGCAAFHT